MCSQISLSGKLGVWKQCGAFTRHGFRCRGHSYSGYERGEVRDFWGHNPTNALLTFKPSSGQPDFRAIGFQRKENLSKDPTVASIFSPIPKSVAIVFSRITPITRDQIYKSASSEEDGGYKEPAMAVGMDSEDASAFIAVFNLDSQDDGGNKSPPSAGTSVQVSIQIFI